VEKIEKSFLIHGLQTISAIQVIFSTRLVWRRRANDCRQIVQLSAQVSFNKHRFISFHFRLAKPVSNLYFYFIKRIYQLALHSWFGIPA